MEPDTLQALQRELGFVLVCPRNVEKDRRAAGFTRVTGNIVAIQMPIPVPPEEYPRSSTHLRLRADVVRLAISGASSCFCSRITWQQAADLMTNLAATPSFRHGTCQSHACRFTSSFTLHSNGFDRAELTGQDFRRGYRA